MPELQVECCAAGPVHDERQQDDGQDHHDHPEEKHDDAGDGIPRYSSCSSSHGRQLPTAAQLIRWVFTGDHGHARRAGPLAPQQLAGRPRGPVKLAGDGLGTQTGRSPRFVFSQTDEPKSGKLRLHIDVNATDREQDNELERLLAAGAPGRRWADRSRAIACAR